MSRGFPLWPYPPHTNTPTTTCRGSTLRHYPPPLHQFSHALIAPLRRPGHDRVARRTGPSPHHTTPPPTGLLLRRQGILHESLVGWPGPTPSLEGCRDPWPRPPRGVHASVICQRQPPQAIAPGFVVSWTSTNRTGSMRTPFTSLPPPVPRALSLTLSLSLSTFFLLVTSVCVSMQPLLDCGCCNCHCDGQCVCVVYRVCVDVCVGYYL